MTTGADAAAVFVSPYTPVVDACVCLPCVHFRLWRVSVCRLVSVVSRTNNKMLEQFVRKECDREHHDKKLNVLLLSSSHLEKRIILLFACIFISTFL